MGATVWHRSEDLECWLTHFDSKDDCCHKLCCSECVMRTELYQDYVELHYRIPPISWYQYTSHGNNWREQQTRLVETTWNQAESKASISSRLTDSNDPNSYCRCQQDRTGKKFHHQFKVCLDSLHPCLLMAFNPMPPESRFWLMWTCELILRCFLLLGLLSMIHTGRNASIKRRVYQGICVDEYAS